MDFFLPALVATLLWWASTIVILYRAGMQRCTYRATLLGATAMLVAGVVLVAAGRTDTSSVGAYLGFAGALAIFGWHEVSYLFGFVNGPRPKPCPANCSGWERFRYGVKTSLYHELAVLATVAAIGFLSSGAGNKVGFWTLVVLWLMRWSAKLNIFLGVPNLHSEFWPEHLAYLKSYVRERSMNGLFPLSIIAGTTSATLLFVTAVNAPPGSGARTGAVLLGTLVSLATLEHWLLITPVSDERLWQVGLRSRRTAAATAGQGEAGGG